MGGSAQARDFSIRQTLFQALEAKSSQQPDRMVELLVRVKTPHSDSEPFSEGPLEESLEARRLSVEDSSRDLVSRLEPIPLAAASQVSTDLIPGLAKSPIVLDTYWAARCIHLLVPASQVSSLMNHPHVDGIFEDTQVQAIPEDELTPQTTDALITATTDWWGQHKIRSSEARQRFKVDGQGVLVGHIDTGIDPSHPALNGKIHRFMDFVNKRPSAYDDQGHGTHTAGSIAGGGGMGVAPGVRLVVAKALNSRGDGRLSNLLKAMQWMLDPDGNPQTADYPAVVNNSWGVKPTAAKRQGFESTLFWESVRAWRSKGIVPVFAAGNKGPGNLLVPGAYPVNLGVGATDRNDHVVSFSASGRIDWIGWAFFKPDLCAPGFDIVSASPGGKVATLSGTSMAAPHVTGLLALSIQLKPRIAVRDREKILLDASLDLGARGRGQRSGEGRIDAVKTLELTRDYRPHAQTTRYAPVFMQARRFRVESNRGVARILETEQPSNQARMSDIVEE